jgi:H+-transporting ATPase
MTETLSTKSKPGPAIGSGPRGNDSKKTEALAATSNSPDTVFSNRGLTSDAARRQLAQFGANAMPDTGAHPLAMIVEKFWAPVPWMLEAAIVLELVLGNI